MFSLRHLVWVIVLMAVIVWIGPAVVHAADARLPVLGGGIPDVLESTPQGSLFSNPVGLLLPMTAQGVFRWDVQPAGDGPSIQRMGVVMALDGPVIGVGWYTESVADLIRTARHPVTHQIIHLDTFGANTDWLALSMAIPLPHGWGVGMSADIMRMAIDSQDALGLGLGWGVQYQLNAHWYTRIGIRRLLSNPFYWSNGQWDHIPSYTVGEIGVSDTWGGIMGYLSSDSVRIGARVAIGPSLQVLLDRSWGQSARMGMGLVFRFSPITLQYTHSSYPDWGTLQDTDVVGLSFEW